MTEQRYQPGLRSRLVGYLKIALPLIALALLTTVFLVQKEDVIEGGITFSSDDRDILREGLSVVNPHFSGVTVEGDRYFMTAKRAVPDSPEVRIVSLTDIDARTDYVTGRTVEVSADSGTVLVPEQTIDLYGNVRITTSEGYKGTALSTKADIAAGTLEAEGPVVINGPLGRLEAGSMRIDPSAPNSGSRNNQMFTFENGVKLTFQPK